MINVSTCEDPHFIVGRLIKSKVESNSKPLSLQVSQEWSPSGTRRAWQSSTVPSPWWVSQSCIPKSTPSSASSIPTTSPASWSPMRSSHRKLGKVKRDTQALFVWVLLFLSYSQNIYFSQSVLAYFVSVVYFHIQPLQALFFEVCKDELESREHECVLVVRLLPSKKDQRFSLHNYLQRRVQYNDVVCCAENIKKSSIHCQIKLSVLSAAQTQSYSTVLEVSEVDMPKPLYIKLKLSAWLDGIKDKWDFFSYNLGELSLVTPSLLNVKACAWVLKHEFSLMTTW